MLAILSPAKKLDSEPLSRAHKKLPLTQPELLADAVALHKVVKRLSAAKLAALMDLSEPLAELNRERFQDWDATHELGRNDGKPAVLMFAGDVYAGLDAPTLDAKTLTWGQDHVAILSGLYGLLRPLDIIQPYRLEMGSKLATRRGENLYAFWGDRLARAIERKVAGHRERVILNLASNEYMKAVPRDELETPVVDVHFRELKEDGDAVALMLFAKRARGMMARFLLKERVDRLAGVKDFADAGYRFDPARSSERAWVFLRPYRKAEA